MPFDLQPFLHSDLLTLRPLTADDFNDLYAVARDPLIWKQHPASNRFQADVFKNFFSDAMESKGALVVIDPRTRNIIGSSRYFAYDEANSEVEIGWTFLARAYWGGSYNREMKRLMLEHAFQFVRHVVFIVGMTNIRSQRAMEKIGGKRIGLRRNENSGENIVFQISSDDFLVNPFWRSQHNANSR